MQDRASSSTPANDKVADKVAGRTIPLSLPRRTLCDLLAFAKAVPTVPVQRQMNVARVAAARAWPSAPGWCALFTKAYAITALRFPELRRAYLSFPRPRLYEHPFSVASVAVERPYEGENAVFWGHVRRPDLKPLQELQGCLRRFKDEPLRNNGLFRRMMWVGRLPTPLRRLGWWLGLNLWGRKRAAMLGTFGVSVYSGLGAESLHPISPLTTTLTYGPVGKDGGVTARVVYDHRVMDGATVARALAHLEEVLNREIVAELEQGAAARAA